MSRNTNTESLTPRTGLLAHPSEVHSLLFHALVVAGYGLAFAIYLHPHIAGLESSLDVAAFVAAAALMLGWISGINVGVNYHNHAHRPVLRSRRMNRWLGRFWTVFGGWPDYFWSYAHVTVHHKRLLQQTDWTLPRRNSDGEWESLTRYSLRHWPWRYAYHFFQEFRPANCGWAKTRRALKELAIFLLLWSVPFCIDPMMAIWLWLLPHWIGNALVMGPGMYVQHAGCEVPGDHHCYRHSTTFLSRSFNLMMFNIGYHAEHHSHPGVHWSELPEFHESVKSALILEGTHVVPFGYYQAGYLLSRGKPEFYDQDPRYLPLAEQPPIRDNRSVRAGRTSVLES